MAKRRYTRKTRKGRSKRRRVIRRYRKPRMSRPTMGQLGLYQKDRANVKFKYDVRNLLLNNVSSYQAIAVALNSAYDAGMGLGTGNAAGWDSYMGTDDAKAFYESAVCLGSSIKVEVINAGQVAGALMPVEVCVFPQRPGGLSGDTMEEAVVARYAKSKIAPATGGPATTLKHYISVKKMAGENPLLSEANFAHTATTNPANLYRWVIAAQAADGASAVYCYVRITVKYYYRLYNATTLNFAS